MAKKLHFIHKQCNTLIHRIANPGKTVIMLTSTDHAAK